MVEKKTAKKKVEKPKVATIEKGEPIAPVLEVTPTPAPVPERIRMRMTLANQRAYQAGKVYRVPEDVPAETAASWLKSGAAEEDKSLDGPPETK